MSSAYVPLSVLKRKESEKEKDQRLLLSSSAGTITEIEEGDTVEKDSGSDAESNVENPSFLKSVGIFRLAAILFFMGYGGSYGVERMLRIIFEIIHFSCRFYVKGTTSLCIISFFDCSICLGSARGSGDC